jgi:DNA-binding MarR family transcriptional regulator
MKKTETDRLDAQLDVWTREIPGLDRTTEGIVQRIHKISRSITQTMETTLSEFGLAGRAYRVLGRLRYEGKPYRVSAGELAEYLGLSSGAMTNRLDRLEQAGLVRRLPDPTDRRGVLVEPTKAGHAAWDSAVSAQAEYEKLIASALSDAEKEQLHNLLRRLMAAYFQHVSQAGKRTKPGRHDDEAGD